MTFFVVWIVHHQHYPSDQIADRVHWIMDQIINHITESWTSHHHPLDQSIYYGRTKKVYMIQPIEVLCLSTNVNGLG